MQGINDKVQTNNAEFALRKLSATTYFLCILFIHHRKIIIFSDFAVLNAIGLDRIASMSLIKHIFMELIPEPRHRLRSGVRTNKITEVK